MTRIRKNPAGSTVILSPPPRVNCAKNRQLVRRPSRWTCAAGVMAIAFASAPAAACSTCFGDPESSMVKGAVMGVYVLVGIVSFVLAGIAGTSLFWLHRSRVVASQDLFAARDTESGPPGARRDQ